MNHAYDDFGQGSQSPYTIGRGAHPGAVLLSPQSSAMNLSNSIASPMVLSPKIGGQSHSMFFNDVVDVPPLPQPAVPPHSSSGTPAAVTAAGVPGAPAQGPQGTRNPHATHNSAAGSAVLSPMVQSPSCNPSGLGSTSMFLDSFTRPSSTSMLGVHSKPNQAQTQSQQQQQHPSQQARQPRPQSSQTATTATAAGQHLSHRQQPPQHQQQSTVPLPQAPNNPVVNFTQDINQLCSWLSMLSSAQQNTVMDNLLFTLHEDVLQYTKLKLNSLVKSGYISPQIPAIASPVPNRDPYPSVNLDSVFSKDNVENDSNDNSVLFQQWSPQPTSVTQPIFDYIKDVYQRPKSADPHVSRATGHGSNVNKPKRNLGIVNNSSNSNANNNVGSTSGLSNNNISNSSSNSSGYSNGNHHFTSKARATAVSGGDFDSSGSTESLSRPSSRGNPHNITHNNNTMHNNSDNTSNINSNSNDNTQVHSNNNSFSGQFAGGTCLNTGATTTTNTSNGSSMNPKTLTDPKLLTNIPVWLKSLRLHKYSDALSSKRWDELIYLDDETLERMGISALGARRKLLKAFAVVKEYKEQGLIDQSAYV